MSSDASDWALPRGYRASAVKAGIKPSGNLDLAALVSDAPCAAAGTFTLNRIAAAPVNWCRGVLPSDAIRAIVVNAGNANAATGAGGFDDARRTAGRAAEILGCAPESILLASTGVIGHRLPMDRLLEGLGRGLGALSATPEAFEGASQAILTTDTRPKVVHASAPIGGREVRVFGMAKGAAMIAPRMATMLGFLLTDAPVAAGDLQEILKSAVDDSFNCISVEGHTSTNDTVLLLANGQAGGDVLGGADLDAFAELVRDACIRLARMIPEDGEGATHLITVEVRGCRTPEEARAIARTVADSPLVKTAIHGADPNWGRIVSAAGYAGVAFEESELSLTLNGVPLYEAGTPLAFDAAALSADLRANRETSVTLTFTRGDASTRFWTCDLTAEYVRLNADYTT